MTSSTFVLGGELEVSRLGFGAMRIVEDPDQAPLVLRRALELGVNLIDTADIYGTGRSEELIADALHPYPDGLVIATKGGPAAASRSGTATHGPSGCAAPATRACAASVSSGSTSTSCTATTRRCRSRSRSARSRSCAARGRSG